MKKTALLRKTLQEEQLLVTAGAHDALTAKIIEKAGFKVVFLSGFGFEASLLGKPDIGLLTMSEVVDHAHNIAEAVEIPVLADAESGYGGPGNLQRTIREFERAGVAGVFIEDQVIFITCPGGECCQAPGFDDRTRFNNAQRYIRVAYVHSKNHNRSRISRISAVKNRRVLPFISMIN